MIGKPPQFCSKRLEPRISCYSFALNGASGTWIFLVKFSLLLSVLFSALSIAGPVYDIHNEARGCQDIPELDNALAAEDSKYFAGWSSRDFTKAEDWAEACKSFGDRKLAATRVAQIEAIYDTTVRIRARPTTLSASEPISASPANTPALDIADRAKRLADQLRAENAAAAVEPEPSIVESSGPGVSPSVATRSRTPTKLPDRSFIEPDESRLVGHNHYTNVDGIAVHSPAHTADGYVPPTATAECGDGSYSFSRHHRGACSHHGGVAEWLN